MSEFAVADPVAMRDCDPESRHWENLVTFCRAGISVDNWNNSVHTTHKDRTEERFKVITT